MFSKKWLAIILASVLTPVFFVSCHQKQKVIVMTPEEAAMHRHRKNIEDETDYFRRTLKFLPPHATDIKMIGNGWVSFIWNNQCFFIGNMKHRVWKSAGMITNMDMAACYSAKDLRKGPVSPYDKEDSY